MHVFECSAKQFFKILFNFEYIAQTTFYYCFKYNFDNSEFSSGSIKVEKEKYTLFKQSSIESEIPSHAIKSRLFLFLLKYAGYQKKVF
ncbi:hypothetical protein BpHYR1_036437 [Brachionus plicatilis]|uniref:Uncharacterized protein n=1 Tax=Brachionus plicatilis TaxID=10195 RepID=A0A3M7SLF9_BRAPC|nr:hypothetical protein BpHYR1_036437 [Brachionus plicatilis]